MLAILVDPLPISLFINHAFCLNPVVVYLAVHAESNSNVYLGFKIKVDKISFIQAVFNVTIDYPVPGVVYLVGLKSGVACFVVRIFKFAKLG